MAEQTSAPQLNNSNEECTEINKPRSSPPPNPDPLKHEMNEIIVIDGSDDDDIDLHAYDSPIAVNKSVTQSPLQSNKKRKQIKRARDHYNNVDHKAKKMKREYINLLSSDSESETTGDSKYNPIFVDTDDDEDEPDTNNMNPQQQRAICTSPDFDEKDGVMSYRFDDDHSMSPGSPSLSVGSLTIRFEDTMNLNNNNNHNNNEYQSRTNRISQAWQQQANPHHTIQLQLINDLKMPRDECIQLIEMIRSNNTYASIHGSLFYRNRLIAMTIGLLEVMNLRTRDDDHWNSSDKPQVLLIAPRRHMAMAARKMFMDIGKFYEVNCAALIGGMPSYKCIQTLRSGLDVITGTPGKLSDMVRRGVLNKDKLSKLVAFAMDGGEELMSGMKHDLLTITDCFPDHPIKILWMDSITQPNAAAESIRDISGNSAQEAVQVYDNRDLTRFVAFKHVEKNIEYHKSEGLEQILRCFANDKIVVFFESKKELRRTYGAFVNDPNRCSVRSKHDFYLIDGRCSNDWREQVVNEWKSKENAVMFGTDLIKFGINLNCSMIIMMSTRNGYKNYIERMAITDVKDVCVITMTNTNAERRELGHIIEQLNAELISYDEFSQKRRNKSIRKDSLRVLAELQT